MIYCCFCVQFYPTFTLPFKLTKIVMVVCLIFVIVSTAMHLLMWNFPFFFFYSDFCLLHVFCVCVPWLLSVGIVVTFVSLVCQHCSGNCFIGTIVLSCIPCRILTLDVIMLSGGADVWFNTQPFFLHAQTTNDVVLEAVTVPIRTEFQWGCLTLWASGDAFCSKVGK